MPTRLLFPLFLLAVIGLPLIAGSISIAASSGVTLLEYDYGGDLPPGYRVTVRMHAVGYAAWLVSAFADAGVEVDGWKYGIVGDDGAIPIHVRWLMGGAQGEFDKIIQGWKEYDATLTLTAYCVDEVPPGAPHRAPDGFMWVYVEFSGPFGEKTDWIPVRASPTAPHIQLFYERGSAYGKSIESWVEITDSIQWKQCDQPPGNAPDEGHDTRDDHPTTPIWESKWFQAGVILVLILAILRVILP